MGLPRGSSRNITSHLPLGEGRREGGGRGEGGGGGGRKEGGMGEGGMGEGGEGEGGRAVNFHVPLAS